jgi:N-acetylmuramoyl-L-alanine amidase
MHRPRPAQTAPPDIPLCRGQEGEPIRDLQRRLSRLGLLTSADTLGYFGDATACGVAAFQSSAGLHETGDCDAATWAALVESGYELGERLLYHRKPMLRGEDVAIIQRRLSELGFQNGRVDGIFGPDTAEAVTAFQRNSALVTDGVVGPAVLEQLRRLGTSSSTVTKAHLREELSLRSLPRQLAGTRLVVAEPGMVPALVRAIATQLEGAGSTTLVVHHSDGSARAADANRFDAHAFLGFEPRTEPGARLSYYRTEGFESTGGRRLAEATARSLTGVAFPHVCEVHGMRTAVLRETRMPALWCEIGPTNWLVEHAQLIAASVVAAVSDWTSAPAEDVDESR